MNIINSTVLTSALNAAAARLAARFLSGETLPFTGKAKEEVIQILREKGEVVVDYSTVYGVEVYLNISGVVLESDPDVENGAFIAPREAVKGWAKEIFAQGGFLRGEVYAWTTSWWNTDAPVLEEFACRTQYWGSVAESIVEKVANGVVLTVNEGRLIAQSLEAAEKNAVLGAWKKGVRGLELGSFIESATGLCALYGQPLHWTGELAREMREFGLIGRGWELFSQNGRFERTSDGSKVFPGYRTGSGWCAEVVAKADRIVERLASGDVSRLSLWLMRPVQM